MINPDNIQKKNLVLKYNRLLKKYQNELYKNKQMELCHTKFKAQVNDLIWHIQHGDKS